MSNEKLEWWKRLVRAYVVGASDEDITKIARVAGSQRQGAPVGECVGVWHATWEFKGKHGDCPCVPCRRARRLPPIRI